jgi:hypothetical protein
MPVSILAFCDLCKADGLPQLALSWGGNDCAAVGSHP